jgi:ABC-type Fe3+/spermidine/putrescine transport system ATPase subunit
MPSTPSRSAISGIAKSSARPDPVSEALRLDNIRHAYGARPALDDVSLGLAAGSFFALLGPSGCGKTTLLRIIGGYLRPDSGTVMLGQRDVTAEPPERRDIGMVFQNYALFPHLTSRANVSFGLEMRGLPRSERKRRVNDILDRVGLSEEERDRYPRQLSGGQQQRVALARALVIEPRLLLLDEPLANLDRRLRDGLREQLRALQRRTGVTTLLVTHDQEEALALADTVGVLVAGRLLQVDTPEGLYRRPRTPFVARFLGDANLLTVAAVSPGTVQLTEGLTLPWADSQPPIVVGTQLLIRPEQLQIVATDLPVGQSGTLPECSPTDREVCRHWSGHVVAQAYLGADRLLTVDVGVPLRIRCRAMDASVGPGDLVTVGVPVADLWVLPERDPIESRTHDHKTT